MLQFRDSFPTDVNRTAKEQLLRVPGLGTQAVRRILAEAWQRQRCHLYHAEGRERGDQLRGVARSQGKTAKAVDGRTINGGAEPDRN